MSSDDLDDLMRHLAPPVRVASDRAARLVDSVLARLDGLPQSKPQPQPWSRISALAEWLAGWVPVPRFAMPMAAAALLGVVVGHSLQAADDAAVLDHLLDTTYFAGLGY